MIYLDNSATTPLCPEARLAIEQAMDCYGNPSSLHARGLEAFTLLQKARGEVRTSLGLGNADKSLLVFCGSGSEATNLALFGVCRAKTRYPKKTILTTDGEHPSVENSLRQLEKEGFRVVRIGTRRGILDRDAIRKELEAGDVFLLSMMAVNNETGCVYDVPEIARMAKEYDPGILVHCDAVQAYGKLDIRPARQGLDLVTVSAHKIHGPKGVGALYVGADIMKRKQLVPLVQGGGQEYGLRSGTENLPGIVGFGAAARVMTLCREKDAVHFEDLKRTLKESLEGSGIVFHESAGTSAPHIVSLEVPGVRSETMLHYLSSRGICVSAGSACSAKKKEPSRALLAFGLDEKAADSTLRISFGRYNTKEETAELSAALRQGLQNLVHRR
ncbi:MAG: cysteine desulfurase [Clostridia bacterium]|nr:cysteine desulfurase [Clostridia bacterium]